MTHTNIADGGCSEGVEYCWCCREEGHDGPHLCRCAGSWEWDGGEFVIVNLPNDLTNLASLRRDGVLPELETS